MNNTHWSVFLDLLKKDSSTDLKQTKMNRNLESGNIYLNNTSYKLQITDNKREVIYNDEGKAIATKPYWIMEDNRPIDLTDYYRSRVIIPEPEDLSKTDLPLVAPDNLNLKWFNPDALNLVDSED